MIVGALAVSFGCVVKGLLLDATNTPLISVLQKVWQGPVIDKVQHFCALHCLPLVFLFSFSFSFLFLFFSLISVLARPCNRRSATFLRSSLLASGISFFFSFFLIYLYLFINHIVLDNNQT